MTGLSRLTHVTEIEPETLLESLEILELHEAIKVSPHNVSSIAGWKNDIKLPGEQAHRYEPLHLQSSTCLRWLSPM